MSRPYYRKILKYWKAAQGELSKGQMDVTALRCQEDDRSIQLLDETGTILAEFGPGRPYDTWSLIVEYPSSR